MTWQKVSLVVRRLQFVKLALRSQQSLSRLCARFGISRKSGYKWLARFERQGIRGLQDRRRRPNRFPQQISAQWVVRIRGLRRRHRTWGSRKLAARLGRMHPKEQVPCARTIGNWLKRLKLNRPQRRRSLRGPQLSRRRLTVATQSNHVWTVDFKGWFRTGDGRRVEPLTVRDAFSCYILAVHLFGELSWKAVRKVFLGLFGKYGYPKVIRVDNGSPFGSKGPAGLTQLSAWWTALGIAVEFITPGHPEQNAAHEQMHGVLKNETTRPASCHLSAQQRRTNRWARIYNQIRPHEGLNQRVPADVYQPKPGEARDGLVSYPKQWAIRHVRSNGEIRWRGRKRFIGEAFIGYAVGLRAAGCGKWKIFFGRLLLGELRDADTGGIRPARYVRGL